MACEVLLQPRARKEFLALPPDIAKKITQALHTLEQKPGSHQSIKLSGGEGYRLQVGDYRILYEIDDSARKVIVIVSSIAEKPIDSPAETMQRIPALRATSSSSFPCIAPLPCPPTNLATTGGEISLRRTPARRAGMNAGQARQVS